ncbi:MAG: glycosyltransferase family 2 protein [Desulfobacterales bacterium]|nr:glycosyltransferase family 2 protein [Desulfobacterales bacterium]
MRICAVIPAFNNETTISKVVEKTRREIDHVVVVDDGSTDETARLARDAGAHVIRVSKNRGKGNALRISFKYALVNNFDATITLDSDLQHDPSEIPKFIEHHATNRSKIVIGARLHGRGKMPRIRYANNIIGTYTFSWLIGQPVEDSQCGFRLYDREVMENIHVLNDGFEAEADILLRAGKRGYKMGFVPIKTIYFSNHEHRSYYRPIKDTFRISIIFLMNLFWKDR